MLVFPNCKINIGLHILTKRADGFHNLETVFYPVPLKDALEIIHTKDQSTTVFSASGIEVQGKSEDNICLKAYRLLKKDFSQLPAVQIHLHKAIPVGAGLGGGSSDAAFTLSLLNTKFQLGLSQEQLIEYALQLGSDCPFFIKNEPCFASGRGEIFEPVSVSLAGYYLLLVNPGIHINTGWAFTELSKIKNELPAGNLKAVVELPVENWKDAVTNHFEAAIVTHYPVIAAIKDQLYNAGAVYTAMSGSGSTLYGLFKKEPSSISFPEHYFTHIALL
ncbi:MAG: 4-(cytidine 5'-diphospho)-2-C-methyl-D-erythritol kinase [Ferruginibacter sp.]